MKKRNLIPALILFALAACLPLSPAEPTLPPTITMPRATPFGTRPAPTVTLQAGLPTFDPVPSATPTSLATPTPTGPVPAFQHIVFILFENKEYTTVIGSKQMPYFNQLASQYTLLNQHYAIRHPSLPNYIALIGGDTFKIDTDTPHTYITAPSLPDFIEASGRTWKTYQESMPQP